MTIDPLAVLTDDRMEARRRNDPLVDRCVLGTVDRNGRAAIRTLVLREIDDRLALFYSRSSAKHVQQMNNDQCASLLIFLPSIGVQYRIEAQFEAIAPSVVQEHWELKPNAAKRMDSIYERHPQSTVIDDIEAFKTLFAATVPPKRPPRNGHGVFIVAKVVERLEFRSDPQMHDRKLFSQKDGTWRVQQIVP